MDEERFRKLSFRKAMLLDFQNKRMPEPVSCILSAIDFDNEVVKIIPIDSEIYEEEGFWTTIDFIELPKRKIKRVK